jgi:4'-phosphopantetheinyl transferase
MTAESWSRPPASVAASPDELHVWRVDVDRFGSDLERLEETLSATELARARRFRFAIDRERFILRRGLLRAVLARYLGLPPETLEYRLTPHGKPEVAGMRPLDLRFNLSHSAGLALIAVTEGREVGVDVERVVSQRADEGVARRFFAPGEVAELRRFEGHEWMEAFFRCWTRKEAYVKARGEGLSFPLDRFAVSVGLDEPAQLRRVEGDAAEALRWSMLALNPAPEYVGAAVVEGSVAAVALLDGP